MATTNTTQAASSVASKDSGRRGVRAALAASVAALGLATALLAPWHQGGQVFAPTRTRDGFRVQTAPAQVVHTASKERIGVRPLLANGGRDRVGTRPLLAGGGVGRVGGRPLLADGPKTRPGVRPLHTADKHRVGV